MIILWVFLLSFSLHATEDCLSHLIKVAKHYSYHQQNFNHQWSFSPVEGPINSFNPATKVEYEVGQLVAKGRPAIKDWKQHGISKIRHAFVMYWDVEQNEKLKNFGEAHPQNPFLIEEDGKVLTRIFIHPGDHRSINNMLELHGAPSGEIEGHMTLSPRTYLLFPGNQEPYFVKFNGEFFHKDKGISEKDLLIALERSKTVADDTLPEPFALKYGNVVNIYRPFHLGIKTYTPGHRIIGLQSFMSSGIQESEIGKIIKANFESYKYWLENELAPKISEFIFNKIFLDNEHHEVHTQNIDLLIDNKGIVHKIFSKDLLDVMEDPVLSLTNNQTIDLNKMRKHRFMSEIMVEEDFDIKIQSFYKWYKHWFEQYTDEQITLNALLEYQEGQTRAVEYKETVMFHVSVLNKFVKLARENLDIHENHWFNIDGELDVYEFARDPKDANEIQIMDMIRDAYIFTDIERNFKQSEIPKVEELKNHSVFTTTSLLSSKELRDHSNMEPFRFVDNQSELEKASEQLKLQWGTYKGKVIAIQKSKFGDNLSGFYLYYPNDGSN